MKRANYLGVPEFFLLNQACLIVREALDTPYLVGSCLHKRDFRDVDVRVILDDAHYDHLFPGTQGRAPQTQALWSLICSATSEQLRRITGLPIDFQIQRMTQANEEYSGPRHALGIYPHYAAGPELGAADLPTELIQDLNHGGSA